MQLVNLRKILAQLSLAWLFVGATSMATAQEVPLYKPASRAPQPLDITQPQYGFSNTAPDALTIGDKAPNFEVAGVAGPVSLAHLRKEGPVVLIFYRGHW